MTNDVIVNLPTAYGKSLLYQYPAFYSSKITIVFVPLKSLLFDSLIEAEQLNIAAA
jgi:superfamily II DNA helicase RecQ